MRGAFSVLLMLALMSQPTSPLLFLGLQGFLEVLFHLSAGRRISAHSVR